MQRTVEGKRRFMLQEEYGFEKKEIDMRKFVCRSSLFLLEIDRKLEIKVFATKKIIEIIKIFMMMKKYVCVVCGWVYNPAVGDPESGIAPGMAFEDIPDDWVCPLCGVGKDDFEVQEE